ncbi:MAG: ribulose-phosphate 3-epimerase [Oligoflexia bacterium]|nr:ribulose-phosphate 3-epimerase [Oligoflexia bacterium]
MFKIAPSILSADFTKLAEEIKRIEVDGVGYLHIDIMDGRFVPNITIGAPVVKYIRKATSLPIDVHLMIEEPEKHVDAFIEAGSDILTFHVEATRHPERLLRYIRQKGVKAGISLNPATSLDSLTYLYGAVDLVLVLTVNPGFGGQKLIPEVLQKVRALKDIKSKGGHDFIIQVDGGVTADNIDQYVGSGGELIVAGNAVFGSKNPAEAVSLLMKKGKKQ